MGLFEAYDAEQEALFIADTIAKLAADSPADRAAVLYRTNAQSRQLEEALRRYNLKYQVVGGFSFYQRAEIKDLLAYLKALVSPQDSVSLLRIINTPARGIGKSTLEQIERFAIEHHLTFWNGLVRLLEEKQFPTRAAAALDSFRKLMEELRHAVETEPIQDALTAILDRTGYVEMLKADQTRDSEARIENLTELVNAAADAVARGESVTEFLDHAALVAEADSIDERTPVCLMTAHNAKGLEFPVIFVAGLEEKLFPHSRSLDSEAMMEEERRLCYVAMTRARRRLILTWARSRRRFGGGPSEPSIPSRFLSEIPRQFTEPLGRAAALPEVDLYADRYVVREVARKNTYTGKTYNSIGNIAEFFASRGRPFPAKGAAEAPPAPVQSPPRIASPPRGRKFGVGSSLNHPRYGRGVVVRREGEGDDAKLTVSFPSYGLKKIIQKFAAGLKTDE